MHTPPMDDLRPSAIEQQAGTAHDPSVATAAGAGLALGRWRGRAPGGCIDRRTALDPS